MILCANPGAQYSSHKEEIDRAIQRVLEKGRYVLGSEVSSFEKEFASYIGAAHGVGVGSGTDALHLALRACGVSAGDEVITVSHTAVATVAAIEMCGAEPVFADIEPDYYTIDPSKLETLITPRTKAIIPVHIYGQAADMAQIMGTARKRGLKVVEDCAQAHGSEYRGRRTGSFGDASCFSFYPTKNLGALGDGGMVVTSDPAIAEKVRLLREYGWAERFVSQIRGWNSRLDEVQAAVLRVKLGYLDRDNLARARIAGLYDVQLRDSCLVLPRGRPESSHVHHLYVVRSSARDQLRDFLEARGVGALIHYPLPVHLQPAYQGRLRGRDALKETEKASREVLSLPIYPELDEADVRKATTSIMQFEEEGRR